MSETVFRIRRHIDGYWIIYARGNRRVGCLVQPVYMDNLGLVPSTADVLSAVRDLGVTVDGPARVVVDDIARAGHVQS